MYVTFAFSSKRLLISSSFVSSVLSASFNSYSGFASKSIKSTFFCVWVSISVFTCSSSACLSDIYPTSSPDMITLYTGLYLISIIAIIKHKAIITKFKNLKTSFV